MMVRLIRRGPHAWAYPTAPQHGHNTHHCPPVPPANAAYRPCAHLWLTNFIDSVYRGKEAGRPPPAAPPPLLLGEGGPPAAPPPPAPPPPAAAAGTAGTAGGTAGDASWKKNCTVASFSLRLMAFSRFT